MVNKTNKMSTENTFVFSNKNPDEPILKLCENGDIFVHGRLADTDMEVVNALRDFINESKAD
tara:strand:+ start:19 stop:204 length:186 start_codon:yes stop_codon:yes gene_type:complete